MRLEPRLRRRDYRRLRIERNDDPVGIDVSGLGWGIDYDRDLFLRFASEG